MSDYHTLSNASAARRRKSPFFRSRCAPALHSVLRIVAGLLFLEHGTGKLIGFPAGLPFIDKMPAGLLYFTGAMELVGGVLIVLGLFTRPVAFVLSGFMAVAYFMAHFPMSFFPAINYRRAGGAVLLRLPLSRRRRARALVDRPQLTRGSRRSVEMTAWGRPRAVFYVGSAKIARRDPGAARRTPRRT